MFGYPKHVLDTSSSFTSGCLWQLSVSVETQHLAQFGRGWLLGTNTRADLI